MPTPEPTTEEIEAAAAAAAAAKDKLEGLTPPPPPSSGGGPSGGTPSDEIGISEKQNEDWKAGWTNFMSCFDNIKDKGPKAPVVPPLEALISKAPYLANMTYDLHPDDDLLKSIFCNENPDDKSKCRAALTMGIDRFVHKDAKCFLSNLVKALLRWEATVVLATSYLSEEYRVNPGPLMAHVFHCCSATECRGFSGKPAGVPGAYYYHCGVLEVIRDHLRQGKSVSTALTRIAEYHEGIACRASERARADREENAHKFKGKGKGKDSDKKKGKGRGKGHRDGKDAPAKTDDENAKRTSPKRRRVDDH